MNYRLPEILTRDEFIVPFDRYFDKLIASSFPEFRKSFGVDFFSKGSYPKCDIIDSVDKVTIEAAVPGLSKKDISLKYDGNKETLTISADKLDEKYSKNQYVYKELKRSAFVRTIQLSDNLDGSAVKASLKKGILIIDIPKLVAGHAVKDSTVNIDIEDTSTNNKTVQ